MNRIIYGFIAFASGFFCWLFLRTLFESYPDNQPAPKKPDCKIGTWDE